MISAVPITEMQELLREQRVIVAALRATSRRMVEANRQPIMKKRCIQQMLLLCMAESLVTAHKAAKVDDDGMTLDLIEDAMRHIGKRLAAETSDGRDFIRERVAPL